MLAFLMSIWNSKASAMGEGRLDIEKLKGKLDPIHAELLQVYKELCLSLYDKKRARKLARVIKSIDLRYAHWVVQWKGCATWDDMTEWVELDGPYLELVNQVNQIIRTLC